MQAHRNNRRVKTKVPGIYYRQTESGRRRYSFTYRDSSGRQHWQTVEGGLEDAKGGTGGPCGSQGAWRENRAHPSDLRAGGDTLARGEAEAATKNTDRLRGGSAESPSPGSRLQEDSRHH